MAVVLINTMLVLLAFIIVFNFGAYSLLLKIISGFRNIEHQIDPDLTPSVSLLIAAYNEEAVLREKLNNCLALDYPAELLEIVVVSDGSTDGTDDIVREFESLGVKLIINSENIGKATSLNNGMDNINSEIVVLSDANVIYQRSAIRKLVRHFADPNIGAVSGKVVLLNEGLSYADGENAYYHLEHKIQQLESTTGNVIGADGAMYALRKELFRPLRKGTLNDDFVVSMGVIQQGRRLIFDPMALGFEQNVAEIDGEYHRKVRIVSDGLQSLKHGSVWPPNHHPLTVLKFTCHKLIRWIIGPVILLFIALSILLGVVSGNYLLSYTVCAIALSCPLLQLAAHLFPALQNNRAVNFCNYLTVMLRASVVGCYMAVARREVTWHR